jgi:hypothetical protein
MIQEQSFDFYQGRFSYFKNMLNKKILFAVGKIWNTKLYYKVEYDIKLTNK